MGKYDIKITEKELDFGKSAIGDSGNMNVITKAFDLIKTKKYKLEKMF